MLSDKETNVVTSNTTLGVKQGDNLSPTLSNIFDDDFESDVDNVIRYPASLGDTTFNHLFFADDLVLISESAEGLQNCMDALSNYRWNGSFCFVLNIFYYV